MNMFKKNEGFTLVELIVVTAILAILAAVAVPAYSGYITKAQEASDMTQLDSMKTAIAFAVAEKDPTDVLVGAEVTFSNLKTVTAKVAAEAEDGSATTEDVTVDISALYGAESYTAQSGATKATMADGKWTLTKGE